MTPRKVTRAMKARYTSRLSCGCYVAVGTAIIRHRGRWVCVDCRLAELADLSAPKRPRRNDHEGRDSGRLVFNKS